MLKKITIAVAMAATLSLGFSFQTHAYERESYPGASCQPSDNTWWKDVKWNPHGGIINYKVSVSSEDNLLVYCPVRQISGKTKKVRAWFVMRNRLHSLGNRVRCTLQTRFKDSKGYSSASATVSSAAAVSGVWELVATPFINQVNSGYTYIVCSIPPAIDDLVGTPGLLYYTIELAE